MIGNNSFLQKQKRIIHSMDVLTAVITEIVLRWNGIASLLSRIFSTFDVYLKSAIII